MEPTTAGTLLRRSRIAKRHRRPKRCFRFFDLHSSYASDMGSKSRYKKENRSHGNLWGRLDRLCGEHYTTMLHRSNAAYPRRARGLSVEYLPYWNLEVRSSQSQHSGLPGEKSLIRSLVTPRSLSASS